MCQMNTMDKGSIKLGEHSLNRAIAFGDYFLEERDWGWELKEKWTLYK